MPSPGNGSVAGPSSAGEALRMAVAGLSWLAGADAASLPVTVQANALRELERLQSMHAAARAKVLAAFTAQRGYEDDGQGSARVWLTWQTNVTAAAARASVGWMRRLEGHPAVAEALAGGGLSVSWARQLTDWTDRLPPVHRSVADVILVTAAAAGLDLAGLAALAEEIRRRVAQPDQGRDDGFTSRGLWLDTTLGGAGRVTGDLSGRCAAALQQVLESLGKKMGAEDTRSIAQRQHDALEEACRRLLASGCLPERAGQPVQLQLHLSLDQLLDGCPGGAGGPAMTGPALAGAWAGPGDDCDAALALVVTGRVDHDLLDRLAGQLAGRWAEYQPGQACDGSHAACAGPPEPGDDASDEERAAWDRRRELSKGAAREVILRQAVALLSGPGGLASWLRTGTLPPPAASVSLPLDVGSVTDLVPPHLRRAIITRDRHCAAPGCGTPPAACHVHHIVPRSQGGATSLANCCLHKCAKMGACRTNRKRRSDGSTCG
ncbi:MAG TPA: DUF222 domain-containing protein, partial [Streptosporangiaceae bacterium]